MRRAKVNCSTTEGTEKSGGHGDSLKSARECEDFDAGPSSLRSLGMTAGLYWAKRDNNGFRFYDGTNEMRGNVRVETFEALLSAVGAWWLGVL
jgi:hypothetical protein